MHAYGTAAPRLGATTRVSSTRERTPAPRGQRAPRERRTAAPRALLAGAMARGLAR